MRCAGHGRCLPSGTTLVILTAAAADALSVRLSEADLMTAVMPA